MNSPEENAFEIYTAYAAHAEDISGRRRAYSLAFFSVMAALIVGPFLLPKHISANGRLVIAVAASFLGILTSLIWIRITNAHRLIIIHRYSWLVLLERYLLVNNKIPIIAQVYTLN